jgi:hypothetical protein
MKLFPVPVKRKVVQPDLRVSNVNDSNHPTNPAKPPCNIESRRSTRKVRTMIRSLSPFRSEKTVRSLSPFSSRRSAVKQADETNETRKEMTFETATTASLSFSRTDEVADEIVDDDASAAEANLKDDVVVTGLTTFTSSDNPDSSKEDSNGRPVVISVMDSAGAPPPADLSSGKPRFSPAEKAGSVGSFYHSPHHFSPEQILAAAGDASPERPIASPDRSMDKPRYSFDILSGPMYDTPVRKYLFSDRFEDISIVEDSTCGGSTVVEETTYLLKDASAYKYAGSEVDESTINSNDHHGDQSVFSNVDESMMTYDNTHDNTAKSASFDKTEKEWDLPQNLPKFVKDLAAALQRVIDDVGNCSSYTLEQARQVEWVETLEIRASDALRSMAPASRRRRTRDR